VSEEQFETAVKVLHFIMRLLEKIYEGEDVWEDERWW
jgi:hypothetical protein